jgi:NAD(P)-dependent dehydrogenase (short-subunit alcohol dehydrogenase family)
MSKPSAQYTAAGRRMHGKTALVTGAGRGIGAAIARRLSAEGAWVGCLDLEKASVTAVVETLPNPGLAIASDVSDEESVRAAIERIAVARGSLDVLVNNAGIAGPQTPVGRTPLSEWRRTLDVNLTGPFLTCKYSLPMLVTAKGCIVNVASALALVAKTDEAAYHASKAGLVHLSRTMALDYAGRVRVNCVCPGAVRTPMIESVLPPGTDVERALAEYGRIHPLHQRLAYPEEIASAVLFLASEDASLITGAAMPVDAGFSAA